MEGRPVGGGSRRRGPERVVLVGYMGSGKSVVGDALARRLEWGFVDFDAEIERREGRTVGALIEASGAEYLRSCEAALTKELAEEPFLVLAPGGGWITRPDLLEAISPGTLSVWLNVSAEEAVRRIRSDSLDRPLKDHPDPIPIVASMLAERTPLFRRADHIVRVEDSTVEEIAFELELIVRTRWGHFR